MLAVLITLLLPCLAFALSLWRLLKTVRGLRLELGDVVWFGLYVMVNALSCVWVATIVPALTPDFTFPPQLQEVSQRVGLGLFICFMLVLFGRGPLAFVSGLPGRGWSRLLRLMRRSKSVS